MNDTTIFQFAETVTARLRTAVERFKGEVNARKAQGIAEKALSELQLSHPSYNVGISYSPSHAPSEFYLKIDLKYSDARYNDSLQGSLFQIAVPIASFVREGYAGTRLRPCSKMTVAAAISKETTFDDIVNQADEIIEQRLDVVRKDFGELDAILTHYNVDQQLSEVIFDTIRRLKAIERYTGRKAAWNAWDESPLNREYLARLLK